MPQIAAKVVFAKSSIFHYNASVNQKIYSPKDMLKDQSSVPKYRSVNLPNPGITRNSSFNVTSISDVTIFNDGNLFHTHNLIRLIIHKLKTSLQILNLKIYFS